MQKKRNQIFNFLYVIAIIMVIDDHSGMCIGFLNKIFPYDSFFMPLFVFASGYFYKKMKITENIEHKVKKFLIPYFIWNMIFILISFFIDYFLDMNWIFLNSILDMILSFFGYQYMEINRPSWFIINLFWVSIIYNICYVILKENKKNDIILTIFFIMAGFLSVFISVKGLNKVHYIFWTRMFFYMQFYNLGHMFNKYIEKGFLKINKLLVCFSCVVINLILIKIFGEKIIFIDTSSMNNFSYWFLPLITSMTGIIFYYEICEFLARKIGEKKFLNFIGRNTFTILETHLLFINIPNFYLYINSLKGNSKYMDFDVVRFRNGAWIRYSFTSNLIGFFCRSNRKFDYRIHN